MGIIIPEHRPKLSAEDVLKIIDHFKIDTDKWPLIVVGIRGYYLNSIGETGRNDRNVYDDAYFLFSKDHFAGYNANADPRSYCDGYGTADGTKGIASLKEGAYYMWKIDLHKGQYEALCQRLGPVTVTRDGKPPYDETSRWLGINNHKGGINTTNSLGCQTIVPVQWDEYINLAKAVMIKKHGNLKEEKIIDGRTRQVYRDLMIPNCLIEEEHRRLL